MSERGLFYIRYTHVTCIKPASIVQKDNIYYSTQQILGLTLCSRAEGEHKARFYDKEKEEAL